MLKLGWVGSLVIIRLGKFGGESDLAQFGPIHWVGAVSPTQKKKKMKRAAPPTIALKTDNSVHPHVSLELFHLLCRTGAQRECSYH